MPSPSPPMPFPAHKVLLLLLLLASVGCLVWRWSQWPAQVPFHFSRGRADAYVDKPWFLLMVMVPVLLYLLLPILDRQEPLAARSAFRRQLGLGVSLFLRLVFCVWLLTGIPVR